MRRSCITGTSSATITGFPMLVRRQCYSSSGTSTVMAIASPAVRIGMNGTTGSKRNHIYHFLHRKHPHRSRISFQNTWMNFSSSSSSLNDNRHQTHSDAIHQQNRQPNNDDANITTGMNNDEIQKFSQMSDQWWDTKYNPLISMNPIRMQFIQQCIQQFYCKGNNNKYSGTPQHNPKMDQDHSGTLSSSPTAKSFHCDVSKLKILDIGCGGGLLCESFVRLGTGQVVVGLDPSTPLIQMAQYHAQSTLSNDQLSKLQYYNKTVQDFCRRKISSSLPSSSATSTPDATFTVDDQDTDDEDSKFDIICCLEVLEHVSNDQRKDMLRVACQNLLRHNGLLFISTISPTIKSFIITILGAEYISQTLPINTHNWHQYISPTTIRNDLVSLSSSTAADNTTGENQKPIRMMERSVNGMVMPITSIPATMLFNQWDWQLDPTDTDVNWIGCYQKVNAT
jgi:2-polyprenyl-3-methyl-5-hydroxy-6-metoxy-1,4-benzoquinol methylase